MTNEQNLLNIKGIIDRGVKKGLFESADEVMSAINSYNEILGFIMQHDEALKNKLPS